VTGVQTCALPILGKTLIASVVMYNYYKWFPNGKVIFLAPTKPLVLQQLKSCLTIMGIPEADTAQMDGSTDSIKRVKNWNSNRVFFCTPQTMHHDLQNSCFDAKKVVLVVFDEAHRAIGSYAYVEIMKLLNAKNTFFRVLALSATPGSDIK
jgi:ERCC4-related helicase